MSAPLGELATGHVTGYVADTIPFSCVDGPGNRFVVFLQGCNFDCVACHNPQTIPGHAPIAGHHPRHVSVDDLLADIRRAAPFLRGITVSGGEATQQVEFVDALFRSMRADPALGQLTRLVDTNGSCGVDVWDRLADVMDGAMVDLKCLDPAIHLAMTGHPNDEVLTGIAHLRHIDRLHEVRLLIVAGINDHPDLIERTADWLAAVDARMRVKVIGFRPHGARPHDPPLATPTPTSLEHVAAVLARAGDFDVTIV
jgi:pyruvate-formate lyase-activating enzyme